MPTTTNNGWTTPADTDLVKDGAAAIRTLGNAIDTTLGVYRSPGLVKIATGSFSAVSSVSLATNTFSSTYDNYRLLINISTATNGGYLLARLRAAGTDNTSASYGSSVIQAAFASSSLGNDFGGSSATSWSRFGYLDAGSEPEQLSADIMSPFMTQKTAFYDFQSRPGYGHQTAGGIFNGTTSFDSLTFLPSAGTITGTYTIYGYAK